MSRIVLSASAAGALFFFTAGAQAALIVASDSAADSVYSTWDPGDNGGTGWGGGWTFRNGGNVVQNSTNAFQGWFVGDSRGNNSPAGAGGDTNSDFDINTPASGSGRAWAMYANTSNELYAVRPFASQLAIGQTLKFQFDNGNVDSTRVLGVRLLANASDISTRQFEVRFVGGDSSYTAITGGGTATLSSIGFTREGLSVEYTRTGTTTFSMKIIRNQNNGAVTQTISGTIVQPGGNTQVNAIAFRNLATGSGATNDGYFNSISITNPNVAQTVNDAVINNVTANNPGNNPVTHTFTATNPDNDPLTWSNFQFGTYTPAYGGVGSGPAIAATFNPSNQLFSWNTLGSPRGIYVWNVTASDGEASDVGSLTIHVTGVPEPGAVALMVGLAVPVAWQFRRQSGRKP